MRVLGQERAYSDPGEVDGVSFDQVPESTRSSNDDLDALANDTHLFSDVSATVGRQDSVLVRGVLDFADLSGD